MNVLEKIARLDKKIQALDQYLAKPEKAWQPIPDSPQELAYHWLMNYFMVVNKSSTIACVVKRSPQKSTDDK